MARYASSKSPNPPPHGGLAAKAVKASARRLAASAKGIQASSSPCHQKRQKAAAIKNTTPVSSQLLAESQSLFSPKSVEESQESAVEFVQVNVKSQLTCGTDFPSDKSDKSDKDGNNNDSVSSDEVNDVGIGNSDTTRPLTWPMPLTMMSRIF
jgi:hypothetical protein